MSDMSLSPSTATMLHASLGRALRDISAGKMGVNREAQSSLDIRERNAQKLELLTVIGKWLHVSTHGVSKWFSWTKPRVFMTLTNGEAPYRQTQLLAVQGSRWTISSYEFSHIWSQNDILLRKSHQLPESQTAHDLLDRIDFDTLVKAWVIFAREHNLALPSEVTETPSGQFLVYGVDSGKTNTRGMR